MLEEFKKQKESEDLLALFKKDLENAGYDVDHNGVFVMNAAVHYSDERGEENEGNHLIDEMGGAPSVGSDVEYGVVDNERLDGQKCHEQGHADDEVEQSF